MIQIEKLEQWVQTLQIVAGFRMAMGDEAATMPMLAEYREGFDEWLNSVDEAEPESAEDRARREMLAAMGIE